MTETAEGFTLDLTAAVLYDAGKVAVRRHYLEGQQSTTTEVVRLTRHALTDVVDNRS